MPEDNQPAKIDLSPIGRRRPPPNHGWMKPGPVPVHRFKVGQTLHFSPSAFESAAPKGAYRVVSLLPAQAGDHQYRIKNLSDGHERVVLESQLSQL